MPGPPKRTVSKSHWHSRVQWPSIRCVDVYERHWGRLPFSGWRDTKLSTALFTMSICTKRERDREIKNTDRWTLLMIKCTGQKKSFRYDTLLDLDVFAGKEEACILKSAWTQDRCWQQPAHFSHHAPTSVLKTFRNQFLLCSCTVCVCVLWCVSVKLTADQNRNKLYKLM